MLSAAKRRRVLFWRLGIDYRVERGNGVLEFQERRSCDDRMIQIRHDPDHFAGWRQLLHASDAAARSCRAPRG
jgi:hypothetical protein